MLESILSSMAGKLSYVNGQFNIFAGASQTPSLTITDDELLAPLTVSTNSTSNNLYNSIKPVYVDASLNYIATDAEVYLILDAIQQIVKHKDEWAEDYNYDIHKNEFFHKDQSNEVDQLVEDWFQM